MNVLVTGSRFPVALDEIRKLGRQGHRVVAADTFWSAPGGHSRWAAERVTLPPPAGQPLAFVEQVKAVIRSRGIALLVPCFEEVFYLARHEEELTPLAAVFAPPFEVLARLHHKATFNALARDLGLPAPETLLVSSDRELAAALRALPRHVARPAWSRGGVELLTSDGPLAGTLGPDGCHPTLARPWIVQAYVDGTDLCTFSVAREGRVVAHCTYAHPKELEHAGGVVFESVDEPEALAIAARVAEATRYHGQLSLDLRRSRAGALVVLECNPRPTAGVHLMADEVLVDALVGPTPRRVSVVPAGVRRLYAAALVRDFFLHPEERRRDLALLRTGGEDVVGEKGDRLPALFQLLSYLFVMRHRSQARERPPRAHGGLAAAYFSGMAWDGEPIA